MRTVVCERCGTVHELSRNKSLTYGSKCVQCEFVIEPYPERKLINVSISNKVALAEIPTRGLGVIAATSIMRGELIERCPVMVIKTKEDPEGFQILANTETLPYNDGGRGIKIRHLLLPWAGGGEGERAIGLGYSMLYNHEPENRANAFYIPYVESKTGRRYIDFMAKRGIRAGDEICHTYNDNEYLWFKPESGG